MRFKAEIFSQEEVKLVHQKTMDLLENTGVWVKSRRAFQLLKAAGVRVDEDKQRVFPDRRLYHGSSPAGPEKIRAGREKSRIRL